jgi:CRP-like cAMP-binding protein
LPTFRNRLLALIGAQTVAALQPEIVSIAMREQIHGVKESGLVYFIEDGVASVVVDVDNKMAVEMGIIGYEGVTGINLLYGDPVDVYRTIMQVAGRAAAVKASRWKALLQRDERSRAIALKFARAFSIQVTSTAMANSRAKLHERLARWLLMVGDRTGPTFPITHEFISMMLGVRRTGVTMAVQLLERDGLIAASRGSVTILDRARLMEMSNGSYGFAEAHYERLLRAPR